MTKQRYRMAVAAHLWLYDASGRVLFMRRSNTGYADGYWSIPAGHVDPGETIAHACAREAAEEVGVNLDERRLRFQLVQQKRDFDNEERLDFFFVAHLPPDAQVTLMEPDHCDGLVWRRPDDAPDPLVEYVEAALSHLTKGTVGLTYFGFDSSSAD